MSWPEGALFLCINVLFDSSYLFSCIINPLSPFYAQLSAAMSNMYEDALFPLDALVLEENSRDFLERSAQACKNAEILADHLVRHPKGNSSYILHILNTSLKTRQQQSNPSTTPNTLTQNCTPAL